MDKTRLTRPIDLAIEKAGSKSALARAVGVRVQAVQYWAHTGEIPLRRVPAVAKATGLPLETLSPAFFGEAA